jgi:hypothetical protein
VSLPSFSLVQWSFGLRFQLVLVEREKVVSNIDSSLDIMNDFVIEISLGTYFGMEIGAILSASVCRHALL